MPATGAPPARTNHSLAFDMPRQRILLFGGETTTGALDDLWSYDGTAWTAITATGPSVRHSHAMTYDTSRDHLVVFGGLDGAALGDTWEYHPSTGTASHSLYGSGCAGSNGVPSLTATSLPLIGDWFSIALANGRANTIAASVVGFSDTQWGAVPLPLPLAGIGAPGCTLLTSIDQTDLFPIDNFGNGSLSHLAMEAITQKAGVEVVHLPMQGSPAAMTAILRNDVQVACLPAISVTGETSRSRPIFPNASRYAGQKVSMACSVVSARKPML